MFDIVIQTLFTWHQDLEFAVRTKFNETCQRRLKDNNYKVRIKQKEPTYMQGPVYEEFTKLSDSPDFQKKSRQAKINKRRGKEDGPCEPTHHSGSMSYLERATRMVSFSLFFNKIGTSIIMLLIFKFN